MIQADFAWVSPVKAQWMEIYYFYFYLKDIKQFLEATWNRPHSRTTQILAYAMYPRATSEKIPMGPPGIPTSNNNMYKYDGCYVSATCELKLKFPKRATFLTRKWNLCAGTWISNQPIARQSQPSS